MDKSANEFVFKVNGEQFIADHSELTALSILTIAKQGNAIPNAPEKYILKGEKGEYKGNELVNLALDNIFITIPVGDTPAS